MTKYKVVGQEVEINGKKYQPDAVVDESDFKEVNPDAPEGELSEVDSLVESGHIEVVEEVENPDEAMDENDKEDAEGSGDSQ